MTCEGAWLKVRQAFADFRNGYDEHGEILIQSAMSELEAWARADERAKVAADAERLRTENARLAALAKAEHDPYAGEEER